MHAEVPLAHTALSHDFMDTVDQMAIHTSRKRIG